MTKLELLEIAAKYDLEDEIEYDLSHSLSIQDILDDWDLNEINSK